MLFLPRQSREVLLGLRELRQAAGVFRDAIFSTCRTLLLALMIQNCGGCFGSVAPAQAILFSCGCNLGFPQTFFAMWHTTLDAEAPPAAILKLRATPPASRSSVVERFFYMGYATAGTRGA
jgi:hypothetical protein